MSRKQLMILFLCFLLPSTVGSAIMSLMSLYARSLGDDTQGEKGMGTFMKILGAFTSFTEVDGEMPCFRNHPSEI